MRVLKYGTGDKVPEGAIYLTTILAAGGFVWHYFLVKVHKEETT